MFGINFYNKMNANEINEAYHRVSDMENIRQNQSRPHYCSEEHSYVLKYALFEQSQMYMAGSHYCLF